jgi:hypothetical protein
MRWSNGAGNKPGSIPLSCVTRWTGRHWLKGLLHTAAKRCGHQSQENRQPSCTHHRCPLVLAWSCHNGSVPTPIWRRRQHATGIDALGDVTIGSGRTGPGSRGALPWFSGLHGIGGDIDRRSARTSAKRRNRGMLASGERAKTSAKPVLACME